MKSVEAKLLNKKFLYLNFKYSIKSCLRLIKKKSSNEICLEEKL